MVLPPVAGVSQSPSVNQDPEETIRQLEKVVSEFMIQYPSHTQRIPSLRPGEHPLIAFVRSMAASMASKQEELESLNEEVIEVASEKERFLANMSHEVRTPMNGIFGLVNLLLEMDLNPVQREYLETIHASSESLLNILDDILDYAKLNANQVNLRPREFELGKLLRDVLLVYHPAAEKKGVGLSAVICDTLPDRFLADDLRLKQILSNLVSNAIKFTDEGDVVVRVRSVSRSAGDQLLFEIRDSGIGIAPEAGERLFAPFRQVEHGAEKQYEGTGLGLAISRNLVELMGGQIWFESEKGKGTSFYFSIDFDIPESSVEATDNMVSRSRLGTSRDRNTSPDDHVHVLLVEDNKVNQKVASLTLQKLGCDVTIANHGREAVELADGPIQFDLICMDVNMPVMSGIEAAREIRSLDHENSSVRILAMTGMAFEEDRERCLEAGMNEVITKPFEIEDLRKEVEALRGERDESVALPS